MISSVLGIEEVSESLGYDWYHVTCYHGPAVFVEGSFAGFSDQNGGRVAANQKGMVTQLITSEKKQTDHLIKKDRINEQDGNVSSRRYI